MREDIGLWPRLIKCPSYQLYNLNNRVKAASDEARSSGGDTTVKSAKYEVTGSIRHSHATHWRNFATLMKAFTEARAPKGMDSCWNTSSF